MAPAVVRRATPTVAGVLAARVDSPVGRLRLVATDGGLASLTFVGHRPAPPAWTTAAPEVGCDAAPVLQTAAAALDRYFGGDLLAACEVPLALRGTPFQLAVWAALRSIPPGSTLTYAHLAARLGRPSAVRAVGAANARNPVSILVPCHRLVGSTGALTGYAGGLDVKRALLDHERRP